MLRRYPMALALTVVVLAGCPGDEQVPPPDGGEAGTKQPEQEVATACDLRVHDTLIARMAAKVRWDDAPVRAARGQLKWYGPRAEVRLNPAYDTAAVYDSGAVVGRLRALEPKGYPRMNLAPGGTTYLWVQACGSQLHLYYISDRGNQGRRAPAWVGHGHDYPADVHVAFRDTTLRGSADSLIAAGLVDSLEVGEVEPDSTSGGVRFITMRVTALCARCPTGGWCTGV